MGPGKIPIPPITIFEQSITRTTPETKQSKQTIQRATYTMARQNNYFDISLKHTAGKEIKFTDFISRNPTKNPEPEENYKEALVINAIAHLATVNVSRGRILKQSDGANTTKETNIRDTRLLIVTRRYQTNKSLINFNYRTQQPHIERHRSIGTDVNRSKMNDYQNARYLRVEGRLRYHWGAGKKIMSIINKRDKLPETLELATRRNKLARPEVNVTSN